MAKVTSLRNGKTSRISRRRPRAVWSRSISRKSSTTHQKLQHNIDNIIISFDFFVQVLNFYKNLTVKNIEVVSSQDDVVDWDENKFNNISNNTHNSKS
jgi:hypothetical protein